ncbi:MAG TPA: hypothetical protein ENJ00_08945 [Phycisphaerales bacterium]|nr:hypothetical protein [Phycisphaerales bacterium]
MCTVTVINTAKAGGDVGYRLVENRDEQHDRARSEPPIWRPLETGRAIWPTDPVGGGTWIAAAETGLALAILNRNLEPMPDLPGDLLSRGTIIPTLIGSADVESVVDGVSEMDLARFAPFRLLAVDMAGEDASLPRIVVLEWDLRDLIIETHLDGPVCLASSGLGDSVVEPRVPLFESMVVEPGLRVERQDAFHAHEWADRPEVSVMMRRADARTVSVTTVEYHPGRAEPVVMEYREIE